MKRAIGRLGSRRKASPRFQGFRGERGFLGAFTRGGGIELNGGIRNDVSGRLLSTRLRDRVGLGEVGRRLQ